MKRTRLIKWEPRYGVFLLLVAYWLPALVNPNLLLRTTVEQSPAYVPALFSQFFSVFSATLLTLPLFLFFIRRPTQFYQNTTVVLRQGGPLHTAVFHTLSIVKNAGAYLLFMYLLMVVAACIRGQQANISLLTYLQQYALQLLALCILAQGVYVLSLLFRNSVAAYAAIYGVCAFDFVCNMFGLSISIPIFEWYTPYQILADYPMLLCAALLLNGALFLIKLMLLHKAEWYKPPK